MPRKINNYCISCGTCLQNCDVQAVIDDSGVYVIDANACVDCGKCELLCPVGAIVVTSNPFRKKKKSK